MDKLRIFKLGDGLNMGPAMCDRAGSGG